MTAATTTPHSTSATSQGSAALAGFDDVQLADWLNKRKVDKKEVVLVRAGTTCKVFEKAAPRGVLYAVDPEGKAKVAFKALAKQKRLFTVELTPMEITGATIAVSSWIPKETSDIEVDNFLGLRNVRLGRVTGRGDPITVATANEVWADAGGCCMFKGCGDDLSSVPLYTKGARIAYLAHIIASDPDGPRGTVDDSHRLSSHPENIMLMCDAHHRLIDSFEPETYDAARLQEMRRDHALKVRRYREAMRYPQAQVMTIFGDLGNVPTHYPDNEFMEALLSEGRSMHPDVKRHLGYKNRDDRTSPSFWENYLRELELSIRTMAQDLRQHSASSPDELAVFALHHSATLVLAGRITGEGQRIRVFQPSRTRKSWQWDSSTTPHPAGTFKVSGLTDTQADEVLLTVELTAHLDKNALPDSLAKALDCGSMPWIRLTTDSPNGECLQHAKDLEQVVHVARSTINALQDKMCSKRIHLIVMSPASATFSIGQLLQAGHHAAFTLYDRANSQQPFREAFTINGYSVVPPAGSTQASISIR
jgi:hypothetical protein